MLLLLVKQKFCFIAYVLIKLEKGEFFFLGFSCVFIFFYGFLLQVGFACWLRLCTECQNLIENHDQIKLLSNARNNLNKTLKVGYVSCLLTFLMILQAFDALTGFMLSNLQKQLAIRSIFFKKYYLLFLPKILSWRSYVGYWRDDVHFGWSSRGTKFLEWW